MDVQGVQERRRQNSSIPSSPADPSSDTTVSALKELIVRLTYDVNSITECIHRVDTHVSEEGYLDAKVISTLLPVSQTTSLLDLPREAKHLSQGIHTMMKTIRGTLLSVSDCTELSKKTFHDQLRKMRDVSNAATRNAVLVGYRQIHSSFYIVYVVYFYTLCVFMIYCRHSWYV